MEVFKFNIHVKPLWFTRNRVYQFSTQLVADQADEDMTRYDCKIKIGGEFKRVLTFGLQYDENWIHNPNSPAQDVMAWSLEWQTDLTVFDGAFTGEHHLTYSTPRS